MTFRKLLLSGKERNNKYVLCKIIGNCEAHLKVQYFLFCCECVFVDNLRETVLVMMAKSSSN